MILELELDKMSIEQLQDGLNRFTQYYDTLKENTVTAHTQRQAVQVYMNQILDELIYRKACQ